MCRMRLKCAPQIRSCAAAINLVHANTHVPLAAWTSNSAYDISGFLPVRVRRSRACLGWVVHWALLIQRGLP